MAEILTESFCERCGSRYTFESAVPRARLRGMKVLSRGFKNFVLDDKTSMDEALAAARDDTDRDLTSHQLEAFHKTFNFCMQCRQYICPNCWNDAEGRCLTCAPMLGHGMLPAPFPDVDPSDGIAASNENGLAAAAMNGHKHASEPPDGLDAVAHLDALTPGSTPIPPAPEMIGTSEVEARAEAAEAEAVEATGAEAANDAFATAEAAAAAEAIEIAALAATDIDASVADEPFTDAVEAVPAAIVEDEAVIAPAVSTEPEADITGSVLPAEATISDDVDEATESAAAAAHTSFLLEGLRPGESLDDAIAAFESQPTVAAELEQLEQAPVEAATTDDIPATPETPVVVDARDVGPAAPDDVTFAAVIESADTMWAPAEEPLVDMPIVADAEPSEPAPSVEPLDEVPTGEALRTDAAIEAPAEPEPTLHAELPFDDVASVEAVVTEPVVTEQAAAAPVVTEPVVTEPATPSSPEPSEVAAVAAAGDVVDQPTWSIVAPAPETIDEVPGPIAVPAIEPPAAPPAEAVPAQDQEPSWPAQPQWPSPQPSLGLPFLGRHVVPTGGVDALWAESDLAVGGPRAGTDKPAGGVQPCVSCGLSLSASARFCRRCGTSQVG